MRINAGISASDALEQMNSEMDAIYVDDNNSAQSLSDVVNGGGIDLHDVLVERVEDGKYELTQVDLDGYRAGHYGTVLDVDHLEAAQYA